MTWTDFAGPVLAGLGAPLTPTTSANLWAWSAQEKTGLHPAPTDFNWWQWNNPLNTEQQWPQSVLVNPAGVQAYASLSDGCAAILATLTNGRYPDIIQAFRDNLPAAWWGDAARSQLNTWGTGATWNDSTPIGADVLATLDTIAADVDALAKAFFYGTGTPNADPTVANESWTNADGSVTKGFSALFAQRLKAIVPSGGNVDTSAILAAIADLKAHPTFDPNDATILSIVQRIEAALKQA